MDDLSGILEQYTAAGLPAALVAALYALVRWLRTRSSSYLDRILSDQVVLHSICTRIMHATRAHRVLVCVVRKSAGLSTATVVADDFRPPIERSSTSWHQVPVVNGYAAFIQRLRASKIEVLVRDQMHDGDLKQKYHADGVLWTKAFLLADKGDSVAYLALNHGTDEGWASDGPPALTPSERGLIRGPIREAERVLSSSPLLR